MPSKTSASEHKAALSGRTPLLDTDGVAEVLGITPRHVRRLVAERRIPFFKVGRFVRFDPGELDVWLDLQRVDAVHRGSRAPGTTSR
jgi:excisionase family DNA binding protein